MNEYILAACVRLDEPEALLGVEPFYDTSLYDMSFQVQAIAGPQDCDRAKIEVLERKSAAGAPTGEKTRSFGRNSIKSI
jgi:hypothetical protein